MNNNDLGQDRASPDATTVLDKILMALVLPPALALGMAMIWAMGYTFMGGHGGRYHPQAFLDAPGEVHHVSGHAFKGSKSRPCEVSSAEVLSYKDLGNGSYMYSCSRWWLDNLIVALGEVFNESGSAYYAYVPIADAHVPGDPDAP